MLRSLVPRNFCSKAKTGFDKIKLIDCKSQSIHKNLALENILFHIEPLTVPTVMMWRNEKTIVFGKHQNPYKEIHMNKIEEENVALARRSSGGGCVYQDLNNTCFSFFIPIYDDKKPFDTKEENNKIILDAIKTFGIEGEVSGRNDLLIEGKKFSGSAYELDLGGKNT